MHNLHFVSPFCQSVDIWVVSTLALLWIMLLWTVVYTFLCGHVAISLGYTARGGVAGSYGNYAQFEKVLECFPKLLPQCMRVPFLHMFYQHLLLSVFQITAVLVGMKWCLIVVLMYVFLVAKDIEHLFICLLIHDIFLYLIQTCSFLKL